MKDCMPSKKSTKKKSASKNSKKKKSSVAKKSPSKAKADKQKSIEDRKNLLRELVEDLAGGESDRIVEILFNKKDVNEFLIAKKMEMTINQVRNILYKLSAEGLVSFIRKKDKRKGWYIYYWTLNTEKCLIKLEQSLNHKIETLKSQLGGREQKRYYICKPCGIEVSEETALEHGFTCEECAEVYELSDNAPHIRDLKGKITRKENDLVMIEEELTKIREKKEKKREREENKRKKAKKAARKKSAKKAAATRARRKKEREAKSGKKKASKKKSAKKKVAKKSGAKKSKKSNGKVSKKSSKKKASRKKK